MKKILYSFIILLVLFNTYMFYSLKLNNRMLSNIRTDSDKMNKRKSEEILLLKNIINLHSEFESMKFPDELLVSNDMKKFNNFNLKISEYEECLFIVFPSNVCNPCLDNINKIFENNITQNFKLKVVILSPIDQFRIRKSQFENKENVSIYAFKNIANFRLFDISYISAFTIVNGRRICNFMVVDKNFPDLLHLYLKNINDN